jgi:hypothetical protein
MLLSVDMEGVVVIYVCIKIKIKSVPGCNLGDWDEACVPN